jgi:hypothetical protein
LLKLLGYLTKRSKTDTLPPKGEEKWIQM